MINNKRMIRQKQIQTARATVLFAAIAALLLLGAPTASANVPAWHINMMQLPAHVAPGGKAQLIVTATNLGDAPAEATSGDPLKISAQLPASVTATKIAGDTGNSFLGYGHIYLSECTLEALACESTSQQVMPYAPVGVLINISVAANATPGTVVRLSASGGGASPVSVVQPLDVSSAPVEYGVERLEEVPLNENGSVDTQAGSHPFQLTTTFSLNSGLQTSESFPAEGPTQPAMPKELRFNEPPGLIGDPEAVPQCPLDEFQGTGNARGENECHADTQIGVAAVTETLGGTPFASFLLQAFTAVSGLYNLTPSVGEPARFGFDVGTLGGIVPIFLDTSVRTGGDYGVVVSVHNISQEALFISSQVSLWGVPADPRHDLDRGEGCIAGGECSKSTGMREAPFLTLPTSCSGASNPLTTTLETASWAAPSAFTPASEGEYRMHDGEGNPIGLDGCNRLPFGASIDVTPDGQAASTPSGLTVGIHVPQAASLNPTGLAQAQVKDTTVTLPTGIALNPAAADGLAACSEEQVALGVDAMAACPDASKVGTLEIRTPLLPNPLVGAAYLAAQDANPFGSLVALYLVAQDPVSGTLIKVAGEVKPDPATGQLVSTFKNTPQLPFEDLKLHFFGGDRAPLATPSACGSYTTTASVAPWSGNTPAESSSTFQILSGTNGGACTSPPPFSPQLTTGSSNIQAGAFTPFTMTMSREDGNQNLQAITLHMPPGLSGLLSGVALCPEPQADEGLCGPSSLIGETIVSVGLGGDPFSVRGGKVYITGPYKGAPYGLSIVNPAKAGPFDLEKDTPCDCVVVRAKINVDPTTAALTIASDNEGPYKIPTMIAGIPLQIKHVNVTINRPGFTFNPTNCTPSAITGSLDSAEGAASSLLVPFQVTNCATLGFTPKLSASTSGKTSRTEGTSLHVTLAYPQAPFGSQANIRQVKVSLPKQLPSRLPTLQKACTAQQFNRNPAGCPATSIVGHAKALTPLIPVPLEGPAYFVSNGGEAWPNLIVVLQGYGVTIHLVGDTLISKAGVTSSTFKTVPDAPVGSFELTLPAGPYSALTANGVNLCGKTLTMPTEILAQNGDAINQNTKITTTGCPKHQTTKAKRKNKHPARTRRAQHRNH